MRKVSLFLLALVLGISSAWADESIYYGGGTGTADDPYLISNIDHLVNFVVRTYWEMEYDGVYFKMTADIDASAPASWGASASSHAFKGTFDGDGHKILNVKSTTPLFYYTGQGSVIKNLTFEDAVITGTATTNNTALLAGTINGTVENCHVVNATQNYNATNMNNFNGGLVAYVTQVGKVENCSYNGTVTTAGGYGSIAGRNMGGAIVNCRSEATITPMRSNITIGGIAGTTQWFSNGAYYNFDNCVFNGVIRTANSSYTSMNIGGIAGMGSPLSMTNCVNLGTIVGLGYTGGLGGQLNSQSLIENSYNMGPVSDYFMDTNNTTATFAMSDYVAGLAGFMAGGTVRGSWNGATIQSYRSAAGLVGYTGSTGGKLYIYDCYNAGLINAPFSWASGSTTVEQSGGLLAYTMGTFETEISNCLSLGTILNAAVARNVNSEYVGYSISDNKVIVTNSYYDKQVAGYKSTIGPMTTTQLTSGTAIEGFDAEKWVFAAGMYPRLAVSAETEAAKLCATPYTLAADDSHTRVTQDFAVSNANGVTWALSENNSAVLDGNNVKVTRGDNVDIVTLTSSLGESKHESVVTIYPTLFAGSGTEDDPYQIYTYADLKKLASITNDASIGFDGEYFKVMNDIDCENDATFERISNSTPFEGILDGDGHSLNNLNLALAANRVTDAGLFGLIGTGGVVKNLNIGSNSAIGLYLRCGTIASLLRGTIENCRVLPASITSVAAGGTFGGIVYQVEATGKVIDCYVASQMACTGAANYVAGIASNNYGLIDGCQYSNTIASTAGSYIGGIVSQNYGTIDNCVSTGRVVAQQTVGGIAARCLTYGSQVPVVKNSLSTAQVIYTNKVELAGAVVGDNHGTFENVVYDKQMSILDNVASAGVTGKLTREIVADGAISSKFVAEEGMYPVLAKFASEPAVELTKRPILFDDGDTRLDMSAGVVARIPIMTGLTTTLDDGDDFTINRTAGTVKFDGGNVYCYDNIKQVYSGITRYIYIAAIGNILSGKGTEENPWLIATEADLRKLSTETAKTYNRTNFAGKHFKVTADITMSSTAMAPIATGEQKNFRGIIHGDGHTISGLTISGTTFAGLVGNLGQGGTIENLTLDGGTVSGTQYVGAFAGYVNGGNLVNLTNGSTVKGTNTYVGGIAGRVLNPGQVSTLTNNAEVSGTTNYVGGVLASLEGEGKFDAMVNNAKVSGGMYSGGVLGYAALCALDNLENNGEVTGSLATTNMGGGVIGVVDNCSLVNNARNYGTVSNYGTGVAGVIGRYWPSKDNSNELTVANCLNAGAITGKTSYVGGVVGMVDNINYKITVKGSANVAPVTNVATSLAAGTPGAGGIVAGPAANSATVVIRNSLNTGWIEGVAANSAFVGSITGYNSTAATYENVVYDKQMSNLPAAGGADVEGTEGLETSQIINTGASSAAAAVLKALNVTDAWVSGNDTYPVPAQLAELPAVRAAALPVILAEGDTRYNVTQPFLIAVADDAEWTGSDIFVINGNKVSIVPEGANPGDVVDVEGDYQMTVTINPFARVFPLTINAQITVPTAITGIGVDPAAITRGNVYTIDGRLVRENATGVSGLGSGIYIFNGKKVIVR